MSILRYPKSIGSDSTHFPSWLQLDIYERKSPKNSSPKASVHLYLPEQISDPSTVSWDASASLGFLGGTLVNATQGAQSGGLSGAWDAINLGDAAKMAAANATYKGMAKVINFGGGQANADALMGAMQGQVRNPFLSVLFRGVDFRTTDMVFKFAPYDEKDCETIDTIVRTLRGSSLPDGSGANQTAFFGYPDEFEFKYIWLGKENKFLNKHKRCVLTSIDTNYTSTGQWAVMRNGFPAEITLSLRFTEIELVLRQDVKEGY